MSPSDFILLTNSIDYPREQTNKQSYDATHGGSGPELPVTYVPRNISARVSFA
jgi:hypothetical protein